MPQTPTPTHPTPKPAEPRAPLAPSRVPQVIVTLDAKDALVIEIAGPNGARRHEPLTDLSQLKILLAARRARMAHSAATIGLDASPTEQQMRHWSKHCSTTLDPNGSPIVVFEDPDCMWCLAARIGIDTSKAGYERARRELLAQRRKGRTQGGISYAGDGSVQVRKIKSRSRKINQTPSTQPSIDLDFSDLGI